MHSINIPYQLVIIYDITPVAQNLKKKLEGYTDVEHQFRVDTKKFKFLQFIPQSQFFGDIFPTFAWISRIII